ncbi:hypothetical protein LLE49_20480 [Alicyclobacillus tolerans]|uniref:hypothetical protein n=1 Tax=Alicyclobacillus tolerans TaxID=90970 RepID=UPI001F3E10CF|nr:hypothetical protein [Alicyclobacillus tolerans]MCF8567098.1 hypothetical protein [Alicyclobacillus tolerans]
MSLLSLCTTVLGLATALLHFLEAQSSRSKVHRRTRQVPLWIHSRRSPQRHKHHQRRS